VHTSVRHKQEGKKDKRIFRENEEKWAE